MGRLGPLDLYMRASIPKKTRDGLVGREMNRALAAPLGAACAPGIDGVDDHHCDRPAENAQQDPAKVHGFFRSANLVTLLCSR